MGSTFMCYASLCLAKGVENRTKWRVRVSDSRQSTVLSSESKIVNGLSEKPAANGLQVADEKERGFSGSKTKMVKDAASKCMDVLWDDGYGTSTVKDYLEGAEEMITPDGGPPRWFCPVECGEPLNRSPLLLFLPGLDGIGLGLILHHKALGIVFEVRCLHIPLQDRTPFQEILRHVEEAVLFEHTINPNKPIYLVGDCLGACLALAVAARNSKIDLVLILCNPATSYNPSKLQPILLGLNLISNELHFTTPYFLSFLLGNPLKLASVSIDQELPPSKQLAELSVNFLAMLPHLSGKSNIITRETIEWKLQLIESAAAYANSRLHAVKAEVLILASGNDQMLPSRDEAERLRKLLQNCRVCHFKDNGHALLLEKGLSLLTIIKGTLKYRRSKKLDYVSDFIPPSMSEFRQAFNENLRLWNLASSCAMFSTLESGKIIRGLSGVQNEGPVILVGNHMLMGMEIFSLAGQFLREKNILLRGVSHPELFNDQSEEFSEFSALDWIRAMGIVPVSGSYLYKLLDSNSHVLLYPGGVREALHLKGEENKLFWPNQPEFVRMAAKFGATIVPFGVVGEDDVAHYALDFNDLAKIPGLANILQEFKERANPLRDESQGEVGSKDLFFPLILPKLPGRLYFLFGKGIKMEEKIVGDREKVNQLYMQIQIQVKQNISYLLKKRREDPYGNIIDRIVYRHMNYFSNEVPAFEP